VKANAIVLATWVTSVFLASLGCTREPRAGDPPTPAPPSTGKASPRRAAEVDGAVSEQLGRRVRVALIAKSASNPAFLAARIGAEDRARELSLKLGIPIEIAWMTPPQENARLQVQRIAQAVNERFDAILISCSDDVEVARAIDDAVSRGVAVMTFDSDAPRTHRFAFCGVDDEELGRTVMKELVRVLPRKARIAILAGNREAPNLRRRVDGFMQEAASHRRLKVVGTFFHAETADAATAELLRVDATYPRGVTGWAIMGGWPLYTRTLLTELQARPQRNRPAIVAVNALPAELVYVEKGLVPVLLAQPTYLWGTVGVQTIVDKLVLKKAVPEKILLQPVQVTSAKLGTWARQLRSWGFVDVPEEYLNLR
jgi:ribose transport system substrate-binding protein